MTASSYFGVPSARTINLCIGGMMWFILFAAVMIGSVLTIRHLPRNALAAKISDSQQHGGLRFNARRGNRRRVLTPVLVPVMVLLASCAATSLPVALESPDTTLAPVTYPLQMVTVPDTFRSFEWFASADIPVPSWWSQADNVMLLIGTDVGTGCLMVDEFAATFDPGLGVVSVVLLPVNYVCDTLPGAKVFEMQIPEDAVVNTVRFEGEPVERIDNDKASGLFAKPSSGIEPTLDSLPLEYGVDEAIAAGVVVRTLTDTHNDDVWDGFRTDVINGIPAAVRVGSLTTEGDLILYDYEFDGEWVFITTDTRRDRFAGESDRIITTWQVDVDTVIDRTEIG